MSPERDHIRDAVRSRMVVYRRRAELIYHVLYVPANTNKIPQTKVRFFLPELQWPTKHIIVPINRISRLVKGNHVDRLMVTAREKQIQMITGVKLI